MQIAVGKKESVVFVREVLIARSVLNAHFGPKSVNERVKFDAKSSDEEGKAET